MELIHHLVLATESLLRDVQDKRLLTVLPPNLCVCVCVTIPFVLNVWLVDIPAGATQEEGHAGFLYLHLTGLTLDFNATRLQPLLCTSIVKSDFLYERLIVLHSRLRPVQVALMVVNKFTHD